jgi:hypothetical protein
MEIAFIWLLALWPTSSKSMHLKRAKIQVPAATFAVRT